MAATILVGDVLESRSLCSIEQQVGINVRHHVVTFVGGAGLDMDLAAAQRSDDIATAYASVMPITATYRGMGLRRLTPDPTLESLSDSSAQAGVLGGEVLPGQICGLIKLVTDTPGPKGRGRMYLPFPAESSNDATGRPTAAYQLAADTIGQLHTTLQTIGNPVGDHIIVQEVILRKATLGTLPTTNHVVRDTWATQRRRRIGVAGDVPPI